MERTDPISRRRALGLVGSATGIALVSGCLADGEDEEAESTPPDDGEGDEDDGERAEETAAEEEPTDTGNEAESDTQNDGSDEDSDTETDVWEDVDEIVLSATTAGWEGVEPEVIAGEENPTLVLTEGAEYVLTWKNADGVPHNVELWDEHGEVVDEYETDLLAEEGERQSLEFEATAELAEYVCELHDDWGKRGDLEVETDG